MPHYKKSLAWDEVISDLFVNIYTHTYTYGIQKYLKCISWKDELQALSESLTIYNIYEISAERGANDNFALD